MRRPSIHRSGPCGALLLATLTLAASGCRNRGHVEPPPPPAEEPAPTGDELLHPAAPITIQLPEGWRHEVDEGSVTLIAPGDEVIMIMIAINAADLEESLRDLNQELGRIVRGADIAEIEEVEIDGMSAMVADGQGTLDTQPVDLGLMLLRAPNGRIVMIVGIALKDASAELKEESTTILTGLRAAE